MEVMNIVWPDNVDGLEFDMLARVAGQTYRYRYYRAHHESKFCEATIKNEDGTDDERAMLVNALRLFADYVEKACRITDAAVAGAIKGARHEP